MLSKCSAFLFFRPLRIFCFSRRVLHSFLFLPVFRDKGLCLRQALALNHETQGETRRVQQGCVCSVFFLYYHLQAFQTLRTLYLPLLHFMHGDCLSRAFPKVDGAFQVWSLWWCVVFGCVSLWFPNVKSGFAHVQVSFPCFFAVGGHIIVSRIYESEIPSSFL